MILLFVAASLSKISALPGGSHILEGPLNTKDTWVIGKSNAIPPKALRLYKLNSVLGLKHVPDGNGVVLDIEDWPLTPITEKSHPIKAYRQASEIATKKHLWIVGTPAIDLVKSINPNYRGKIYNAFVKWHLAQKIAPFVQVYEIQAQGIESNPYRYKAFVEEEVKQIRLGNPNAIILAGLSTNPSGQKVNVSTLYKDIQLTRNLVSGYWLNVPSKSIACPKCGIAKPKIALKLLKLLFKQ